MNRRIMLRANPRRLVVALSVALLGSSSIAGAEEPPAPIISGKVAIALTDPSYQGSATGLVRPSDVHVYLHLGDGSSASGTPEPDGTFAIPLPKTDVGRSFWVRATTSNGLLASQTVSGTVRSSNAPVVLTVSGAPTVKDAAKIAAPSATALYTRMQFAFVTDRIVVGSAYGTDPDPDPANLHYGRFSGLVRVDASTCPSGWVCSRLPLVSSPVLTTQLGSAQSDLQGSAGMDALANEVRSRGSEVILFVHGFNSTLEAAEEGLLRLGFIADWPSKRTAIVYSWPSKGQWNRYTADGDTVTDPNETRRFVAFLTALEHSVPAIKIHLMVHSMGHRLVFNALEANPDLGRKIVSAQYFAPDTPADSLDGLHSTLANHSVLLKQRVYSSMNDLALRVSACINNKNRLGQASPSDFADITHFDASLYANPDDFGHTYFQNSRSVARDIYATVNGRLTSSFGHVLNNVSWLKDRDAPLTLTLQETLIESSAGCRVGEALI